VRPTRSRRRTCGRAGRAEDGPGDAVTIHTGWGQLWDKDVARYGKTNPGIGDAAAEWLARQNPILVGSDVGPVEISPNPDKRLNLPIHQIMLVVNGIHLLENLRLDELAARRAYEFALIVEPLKIQGDCSTAAPVVSSDQLFLPHPRSTCCPEGLTA
jgi:kynurenine formamidase